MNSSLLLSTFVKPEEIIFLEGFIQKLAGFGIEMWLVIGIIVGVTTALTFAITRRKSYTILAFFVSLIVSALVAYSFVYLVD